MFCFYYTIVDLYFLNLAAAGLHVFGPLVWAGPGPEMCGPGLGHAWARNVQAWKGRAWA